MVLVTRLFCSHRVCTKGWLSQRSPGGRLLHGRRRVRACVRSSTGEDTKLVFRILPLSVPEVNGHVDDSAQQAVAIDPPPPLVHPAVPLEDAAPPVSLQPTEARELMEDRRNERLEAAVRSELFKLELGPDASELSSKVASKYEGVMDAFSTKFSKIAEEQDQLQNQTAGIAKQLQNALGELEKLVADRLIAEQQAVQADLDLQQSILQLEVATAERDAAVGQSHRLKTALQVWEAKNQRLASQLRAARQDVVELSESQSKLESRFLELYQKRELLEKRVVDAEEMATDAQSRVEQLQRQVSHLSESLTGHADEATGLSNELEAARQDLRAAQEQQQHMSSLLAAAQQEAKTTEELLNVERQRMQALKVQVAAEVSSKAQLQQQLETLQRQAAELQDSSAAAQRQLSAQLAESQRYTTRLRQQLQNTTYQHDLISESNHKLLEQLEVAGKEIQDLEQQLDEARLTSQQGTSTSGSEQGESDKQDPYTATALRAIDQERKTTAIQNQQLREQVTQLDSEKEQLRLEQAEMRREMERLKQQQEAEMRREMERMKQQQDLQAVNSWVGTREVVMKAYSERHEKRHSTMALVEFANKNKFWVPERLRVRFLKTWMDREQQMCSADGFLGLGVREQGEEVSVSSLWLSVATWESWALSAASRRSHLPDGVQQFVPEKGEEFGFPEDFIPFKDYVDAVSARYQ